MNISEFWKLIDKVKNSDEPEEDIKPIIENLSPEEIRSYQDHFDTLHDQAYSWKLWGAAYLIGGGCSDDGFIDFRYGLISKGKDIYENAINDPDSLASIANEVEIENESFGYAALEAFEKLVGKEMPRRPSEQPSEPIGNDWDFDDVAENQKYLPRLSSMFDE